MKMGYNNNVNKISEVFEMKRSKKVYIINGEKYVEHKPTVAEQLVEIFVGFGFMMFPIFLLLGVIIPLFLPC